MLSRQIRRRRRQLLNLPQIRAVLEEEWNYILQEDIQNLMRGMHRRLVDVITASGLTHDTN